MEVWIEGKRAALKRGTAFEYVEENRLFTDADSYTLSITFPLKGCAQNRKIFGYLDRPDVNKEKVIFDCELRERAFYKSGVLTIVEVTESEVVGQFLEGRSAQNYADDFDEVYINELDLGEWPSSVPETPPEAWGSIDDGFSCVALPWVNVQTGVMQNKVVYEDGAYAWGAPSRTSGTAVSWQPYLIEIAKRVLEALDYDYDFSPWETARESYLIVCNALPAAWGITGFARALPHWSVADFFAELEKILGGEFDINHRTQKVTFQFTRTLIAGMDEVCIRNVVDSYKAEVAADSEVAYKGNANRKYADGGHQLGCYYDCGWFIKANAADATHYPNLRSLLTASASYATPGSTSTVRLSDKLLYVEDIDRYFVLRIIDKVEGEYSQSRQQQMYDSVYCLQQVNAFGEQVVKEDNGNVIELNIVPACIDYTDAVNGFCLFVDPGTFGEDASSGTDATRTSTTDISSIVQPRAAATIERGQGESRSEYFDKIFVAYWDGRIDTEGYMPIPVIDDFLVGLDWELLNFDYTLHLAPASRVCHHAIDPKIKYSFYFLADELPSVRSLFYIEGKKYLAERITASFDEAGMSKRLKGEFYMVV